MVDITRHSITWTLTGSPTTGTYQNGDPWVVGPVTYTGKTTAGSGSGSTARHGSMVNPASVQVQGYDGRLNDGTSMDYSDSVNIETQLPFTLQPGMSLVSSISDTAATPTPLLTDMSILTVVASAPAANTFRPAYAGTDKRTWNTSNVNTGLVPSLTRVLDPISTETNFEHYKPTASSRWLNRPQYRLIRPRSIPWDKLSPANNQANYPSDQSKIIGQLGMLAVSTGAERTNSIYKIVQLAIDIRGCFLACKTSYALNGAGYGGSWFFPLVFAGHVLGDQEMLNLARSLYVAADSPGNSYTDGNPDAMGFNVGSLWETASLYSARVDGWSGLASPKPRRTYFQGFPLWGDPSEAANSSIPTTGGTNQSTRIALRPNIDADGSGWVLQYSGWPNSEAGWGEYMHIACSAFVAQAVPAFLMGLHVYYPRAAVDFFYRWINDSKLWYTSAGSDFYNEIYGWGGSGNNFIKLMWEANAVAQSSASPTKYRVVNNGSRKLILTSQGARRF